ncbi:MAG: PD-(D/E)XK nuclease family protein [Gaiellaceae bacterium]
MPLTLLVGPANAGKVERLLVRYLEEIEREPVLVVPNAADIGRVERDLLRRSPALLAGTIGTFDDLFRELARGEARRPLGEVERRLLLRRVVEGSELDGLARSARFSGFADALGTTIAELESALVEPDELPGTLAGLHRSYRKELDRLGLWDRERLRRHGAERVGSSFEAWDMRPVFVYGFEDLTGVQWRLIEALAARTDVTVCLPYEPGRVAFEALEATAAELARCANGRIEELAPRSAEFGAAALAHVERALFEEAPPPPPPLEGAVRFLEAAGARAALELVADETLRLLRAGVPAEEIAIVCPTLERYRVPLETALWSLGVPFAFEGQLRISQIGFGQALLGLLRFAWLDGGRCELFAFVRSSYSGLTRASADFLEGRLRGRAVHTPARIESELTALRGGQPLAQLGLLRAAESPLAAVDQLTQSMLRSAYGLDAPPTSERARLDLRAFEGVRSLLEELARWERDSGSEISREDLVAALERTSIRLSSSGEPGRVAVVDLLRARTRRFDVVFVLGMEEGTFPRRTQREPFLDEELRRTLEQRPWRLPRPDEVDRDRYLFYTICTRPRERLYLVREAASEDGAPRQPSPFWDELRRLFPPEETARWTRRRPLSALVWPVEEAPSERERLRAVAALASQDRPAAQALALANGWDRRIERALAAFSRPTALTHPRVLEELRSRATFSVTELESFADCSSIWLLDRLVAPRTIDQEVDAMLRGSVAHQALHRFYAGLPKRLGREQVDPEHLEEGLAFLRECLLEAIAGQARLELDELQRRELEAGLWHDLEHFIRSEATSPLPLVPRRFEVLFGSERAAPELQRGLDLGGFSLSGKIDRIDLDPFSARGIVQDYKSGKTAHSAARIESEQRLQIPLYMLVLRDLIGVEPLGGVYRALAGERRARGLLREEAREDGIPGFAPRDYLDEEAFWAQVEGAKELARRLVGRIREGDVGHDPRGGDCPSWCELWSMCRIRRS